MCFCSARCFRVVEALRGLSFPIHHCVTVASYYRYLVAMFLPSKPRQHQHKAPRDDHRKRKARLHMSLPALPRALQLYDLQLPLLIIDIEEV